VLADSGAVRHLPTSRKGVGIGVVAATSNAVMHFKVHGLIEAVELLGTVEAQSRHAVCNRKQDLSKRHR